MTQQEQIQALIKQNEELMNQLKNKGKTEQSINYNHTRDTNYSKSNIGELFVDAVTFGAGFSIGDNIIDSILG